MRWKKTVLIAIVFGVLIGLYLVDRTIKEKRKEAKEASERIEFLTDTIQLTHARYDKIRLYRASSGSVIESDPKEIHYNNQISARASRKKWIEQLT